jgi:hypothetical protein
MSPRAGKWVDDDQHVVAESGAWSSSLISSSSGERERLEAVRTSAAQVVDDFIDVLQIWTNRKRHDVCQRERKRLGERGVRGLTGGTRFERERPLVPAGSREGFRWPGGVIQRGKRGKMEREEWATCSRGMESNWEGIEEGAKISSALSLRGINGRRRTMMTCPGGWGPHVSEWREK